MWDSDGTLHQDAGQVLRRNQLKPVKLTAKEGLAMINGTQMIASLGAEALERAETVAVCADVACAMSLEVLCGTVRAFHPLIHQVRPHTGQQLVAKRVRQILTPEDPSELFRHHGYQGKVQDAYSLRCAPQVHGISNDTITFVRSLLDTELNSATDNPMVFTREQVLTRCSTNEWEKGIDNGALQQMPPAADPVHKEGWKAGAAEATNLEDAKQQIKMLQAALEDASKPHTQGFKKPSDVSYQSERGLIISGGNFHGEYPAKALDYLAIGVHELAAISERRIERLCNPSLSGLPAFLVAEGGLNSGFMIAHCTAAAMVSENKVLTHPSSVDSLSTSGAKEDHVSMGGFSARKALEVVEHVEIVIAIELLAACQGLEFHRPLKSSPALEAVYQLVRSECKPWNKDRRMSPDIDAVAEMIRDGRVHAAVAPFLSK
jgi:histidine ammonia-lyase